MPHTDPSTALVWFRRDLRLADHPALTAACERHTHIIPVFIWAPEEETPWEPGAASCWWLHHSLKALQDGLSKLGSPLILRRGPTLESLQKLLGQTGAAAVYWNRLYEPALTARDAEIKRTLKQQGIEAESFNGALLQEPWEMKTLTAGEPYRVFTPFYKGLRPKLPTRPLLRAPESIKAPAKILESLTLEDLALLPRIPWDAGFYPHWMPGEAGAQQRLQDFCETGIVRYQSHRDFPAETVTSRLSPCLHFGELSPQQIVASAEQVMRENTEPGVLKNAEGFIREVVWREFAHHLLFHFPHTPEKPMNAKFTDFPWAEPDAEVLRRWQRGQTGVPIVDAGMRELWQTGIMHNRVRMIVASYLTKNLRIHWQHGARWFWDTLVDASLANNTLGWQWVAGCGADAAPYFRVFNPVLQAQKFDAEGAYIRRWVPELQKIAGDELFAPWTAAVPPKAYPRPLVDLARSRDAALAAYQAIK